MVKLVVSSDNSVVGEHKFDDAARIRIGRKPGCDIVLKHPSVSSVHAIITYNFAHFIEDQRSTNGTFIKGRRLSRSILMEGDDIQIGPYLIHYSSRPEPLPADPLDDEPQTEKTMIFTNMKVPGTPVEVETEPGILTLTGETSGKIIGLNEPFVTLGSVGKHSALVMRKGRGFSISHIHSSAAHPGDIPMVNGEPIDEAGRLLANQDLITVAGMTMKYYSDVNEVTTGAMSSGLGGF